MIRKTLSQYFALFCTMCFVAICICTPCDSSGQNVGINTSSPLSSLHILGGDWNIGGGSTGDFRIGTPDHGLRIGVATDGLGAGDVRIFSVGGTNRLILGNGTFDRVSVDSSGHVGIGLLSPINRLDIKDNGVVDTPTVVLGLISDVSNRPALHFSEFADAAPGSGMTIEYDGRLTAGNNKLYIKGVDGVARFAYTSGGRMGIGTTSPNEMLEVAGNGRVFIGDGGGAARRGILIDAVESGDYVRIDPYDYGAVASMDLYFPGNINIGRATGANGYKLSVNGKIIAEEVRIQLDGNWPDYVFADDYPLRGLEDLEQFITIARHLPGIPPAAEIADQGLPVGDMQRRMMEKIEELTLYIIQQHKEINTMQARLSILESGKPGYFRN